MDLQDYSGTRAEINLDNLGFNMEQIRNLVDKRTMIMAVVKANAYGHGSVDSARVFLASGADRLAISVYQEGIELRNAGITDPILVLNYTPTNQYKRIVENDLILTIYNYEDAKMLSHKTLEMNKTAKIHIKIDTGMGRIGFLPNEEAIKDIIKISNLPNIAIEGVYSHFASAEELDKSLTKEQYRKFNWIIKELKKNNINIPIKHICNSAGIIDSPEYHLDMVRPGIILYGYYPSSNVDKSVLKLKPAMELKTNISHIKYLPSGVGIGYNHLETTKKDSIIATLPIGYGDGYSRLLTRKGKVLINNKRVPIIGRVCMDQIMADVSQIRNIDLEDEATLFGYKNSDCPRVEEISELLGTSFYEILTLISRRVPRIYMKNNQYSHMINYILD